MATNVGTVKPIVNNIIQPIFYVLNKSIFVPSNYDLA